MTTVTQLTAPMPTKTSPAVKLFFLILASLAASSLLGTLGILPTGMVTIQQLTRSLTENLAVDINKPIVIPGVPKAKAPKHDTDGRFTGAQPSAFALRTIPPRYLNLCRKWGAHYKTDWRLGCSVLRTETNFGQDTQLPGVSSGINAFGCCRGPGQFYTENGQGRRIYVSLSHGHSYSYKTSSTWASQKVDGNKDGVFDIFDPQDAVPSTFHYLSDNGGKSRGGWMRALYTYNHSTSYGVSIVNRALQYGTQRP